VLLIALLGLMAVSAAYRARAQRGAAAPHATRPHTGADAETRAIARLNALRADPAASRKADAAGAPPPATTAAAAAPAPAAARPLEPLGPRDRAAIPASATHVAPPEPAPKPQPEFAVARVKPGRSVALRSGPRGRVLARVPATTEFGSPTTLAVAARRGSWVGLTSTALPNGALGWVKRRRRGAGIEQHATRISLRVDLSRRRLELRDGRRVLRTASVGIGRPGSATPTGRFSITDKLSGGRYGPYYGCCILALSGHQVNTPAGWRGGDRLAIHGTSNPASIGVPSSAGCLHASADDLRVLMRLVPLGTPVFIRR
jgi:lipoprotein-anchoring transpeptidase ErfK/SrfK